VEGATFIVEAHCVICEVRAEAVETVKPRALSITNV
jgi:hypothetical protein